MASTQQQRSRKMAFALGGVVIAMGGLAYAAVPLYDLFCRVTGYGGTTQVADEAPVAVGDRVMRIRFNADVARDLPWRFKPVEREVEVRVGEMTLAFYTAENRSDRTIVGSSTFNVTPLKVGAYFNKVECFCFEEQVLAPGETAELPVSFFVDPEIVDDKMLDDVTTITLSYTFFDHGDEASEARLDDPGRPHEASPAVGG